MCVRSRGVAVVRIRMLYVRIGTEAARGGGCTTMEVSFNLLWNFFVINENFLISRCTECVQPPYIYILNLSLCTYLTQSVVATKCEWPVGDEEYSLRPKIFAIADFCASRLTIRLIRKKLWIYYLFCYDIFYHRIYFTYIIIIFTFSQIFWLRRMVKRDVQKSKSANILGGRVYLCVRGLSLAFQIHGRPSFKIVYIISTCGW
jgi:hypothetical protein